MEDEIKVVKSITVPAVSEIFPDATVSLQRHTSANPLDEPFTSVAIGLSDREENEEMDIDPETIPAIIKALGELHTFYMKKTRLQNRKEVDWEAACANCEKARADHRAKDNGCPDGSGLFFELADVVVH